MREGVCIGYLFKTEFKEERQGKGGDQGQDDCDGEGD